MSLMNGTANKKKILSNHPFFVNLDNFYNKAASYAHKRMALPTKTHLTVSR